MARLRLQIEIGRLTTLGSLALALEDLSVVSDLSLKVDRLVARADAEEEVERLWRYEPRSLLDREYPRSDGHSRELVDTIEARQEADRLWSRLEGVPPEIWFEEWYRYQRRGKGRRFGVPSPFAFLPLQGHVELRDLSPRLFQALATSEMSRRLPEPAQVEFASYRNPLEVVLIVSGALTAAGFKFGTFTELARMIRDWSAEKRQAELRAERDAIGLNRDRAEIEKVMAETREINARASKAEIEAEVLARFARQTGRADELVQAGIGPRELEAISRLSSSSIEVEVDEDA